MADNTQLGPGSPSGDTIRDLDRTGTGKPKTEVTQLDAGGPSPNAESLVSQTNPLPVLAWLQTFFDPDGFPIVNPAAPSADVPTATLQQAIIDAIQGKALNPLPAISVAVGTTSTAILSTNVGRRGAILTNTSTAGQRIALSLNGSPAVLDTGIELWPGDAWSMDRYTFMTGPINGIASAASATMAVQEFN